MATASAEKSGPCPTCGRSTGSGLEDLLGKLGISDDVVSKVKSSIQNIAVEEYLTTARDYVKGGSRKATSYAKENPWKVAAGVAVLAVGVGLLITALNRD
jgi:ElaB/YqjD/DUF883 family membrane-anchored ribosome-binding protein